MCLIIPGKITVIKDDIATIDYGSEKRKAKIIEGKYKKGDYVIVTANIISEKVTKKQMEGWLKLLHKNEV